MFMWDEAEYACLGRAILRGEPYTDLLRPPLLPFSGAVAMLVTGGSSDTVLKIPVLLFALVGLGVTGAFLAWRYDAATGLAGMGLLGLAPAYWEHTTFFLTEIPFLAFFASALFLLYHGLDRGSPRCLYAAWACVGLALLTRYTGLLLGPLFVLFALLALPRGILRNRHFWLSPLAGAAVLGPWLLRSQILHGDALVGFKIASGQLQSYLPGVSIPWYAYLVWMPQMLGWPLLLLLVLGLAWALRSRDRLGIHLLLVAGFCLVWFSLYRYKEPRLVTAVLPFLAGLAALGLTRVARLRSTAWVSGVLAVLLILAVVWVRPRLQATVALGYPSFREAAATMRSDLPPGARVMGAPVPQLAWYLDRPILGVPSQEGELKAALAGVQALVVVNWERGQPAYLLDVINRQPITAEEVATVRLFQDPRFTTAIFPPELILRRLP